MIKNEDKIKSIEQFLNIVFDNQEEINDFYNNFELKNEWEYKEETHNWSCRFESLSSNNQIEIGFNDNNNHYGGEIMGTECGEYDFILGDWCRGCELFEILDNKYKSKKTFYNKVKESFKNIIKLIEKAEQEEHEYYQNRLEDGAERYFEKSYDELTEGEQDELQWNLEGEDTYNMMVSEGWIDED
jgi:hypothetical protein